MLFDIPASGRERLRPLFDDYLGLDGCVEAGLSGAFGSARADEVDNPRVAVIHVDFHFLGGDSTTPAATEIVRGLPRSAFAIAPDRGWEALLLDTWGPSLPSYQRVHFQPGRWDRQQLVGFVEALPEGFAVARVTAADVGRFAELASSLVYNYPSHGEFLARGVGIGIEHDGRFVAGCSSFTLANAKLEFEIQTAREFRRRGLATAAAAAMILHCMENGLMACWDAANEPSAALARKLGFVDERPYLAYRLPD